MKVDSPLYLTWIAATVLAYWLSPKVFRYLVLVFSTTLLLLYIDPLSLLVLSVGSLVTVYVIRQAASSLTLVAVGLVCMLLLTVKITFAFNANNFAESFVLFGVSFYTLRMIHVLLEHYLENYAALNSSTLLAYLFFPAIIAAGPIERAENFESPGSKVFDISQFCLGLERLLHGLVLIVFVHNYLFRIVVIPFLKNKAANSPTALEWVDCLHYGIGLYLQFSAYSSIAIGFALLLGYSIAENFNWPFLRTSLVSFWRHWHITLSDFCRRYVFSGVLSVSRSVPLAFLASMISIGLWHAASLNFLFWGLYHGIGLLVTQWWLRCSLFQRISVSLPETLIRFFGWVITVTIVFASFAWTRHNSLEASLASFATLLGVN